MSLLEIYLRLTALLLANHIQHQLRLRNGNGNWYVS